MVARNSRGLIYKISAAVAVITILTVPAIASDKNVVRIYVDGKEEVVSTDANNVASLLKEEDIEVGDSDLVEPPVDTTINSSGFHVNVFRARPVIIVDQNQQHRVVTPYQSAELIAKDAGLKLYDEDKTKLDRIEDFTNDNFIGLKLQITRSIPFKIQVDGNVVESRTTGQTVKDALEEAGVKIGENDIVNQDLAANIERNMDIIVTRVGVETVTVEENVAFKTQTVYVDSEPVSFNETQQEGVSGINMVTYRITRHDGQEIGRESIQTVVKTKSVDKIIRKGNKGFDGPISGALAKLRSCEGSYTSNTGNGYHGAYQFDVGTWGGYGGYPTASAAPPAVQDQKAIETYNRRGWSPWPSCSRSLGLQDIYR